MTRRFVLASNNAGKLREFNAILAPLGFEGVPQSEFNVPEIVETGSTFAENSLLKARNAARHAALPAMADDSGIEVDALDGAPGVYSARYGGPGASDATNNAKLLQALAAVPPERRTARYQCVIAYVRDADDPAPIIAHGTWEGRLLDAPRGAGGFGYDPLFWVPSHGATAAELPPEVKNRLSHRGQALRALLAALRKVS